MQGILTIEEDAAKSISVTKRPRLLTIDFLRGFVLILMTLDHTRDFFSNATMPLDLATTTPALFMTRWITNLCAPTFIFLAGLSAYLIAARKDRSTAQTSWFLFSRGLWLIIAEATLVWFGWSLALEPYAFTIAVFSAIGVSMMVLALLIYLPRWLIALLSVTVIMLHNTLDGLTSASMGAWSSLWMILHEPNTFYVFGIKMRLIYPMIPWVAVMALGYVCGPVLRYSEIKRRQFFFIAGVICLLAFVVLRFINVYGDLHTWQSQQSIIYTLLDFIKTQKYPPSLDYLLTQLGMLFVMFGMLSEKFCETWIAKIAITFGKVPFFYYMLHVPIIHGMALAIVYLNNGPNAISQYVENSTLYGYGLPVVYGVSILVLGILYLPCRWFMRVKAQGQSWIWSYL